MSGEPEPIEPIQDKQGIMEVKNIQSFEDARYQITLFRRVITEIIYLNKGNSSGVEIAIKSNECGLGGVIITEEQFQSLRDEFPDIPFHIAPSPNVRGV